MILVDSSAWIEWLRATGSPVHKRLKRLLLEQRPVAVTDAVVLELLGGVRDEGPARDLRRLLLSFEQLPTRGPGDFEQAAAIARLCRRHGRTPRSRLDCLIAAVALRHDVEVLHRDRDFDLIARHTPLRVHQV